jgi:putative ABC transport system permease protein
MTHAVAQLTRELDVRLALGAQRLQVLRFVLGPGRDSDGMGIGIGLLGTFAPTRCVQGMLFGLDALELEPVRRLAAAD